MTSRDFCYWLQGFFEINGTAPAGQSLDGEQTARVRKHLEMVFVHEIDPSFGPKKEQDKLNDIHGKPRPPHPDVQYRC